ncbi:smad nuclear interacting protein 1 isoform X2 [Anabrus simplex]|uniref:smad nuclear interacting protein 1 isoform X2 n=1 Tax=Anabrus simplex TaxID=316456 RepID=UPI0035A2AE22
MKNLNMDTKSSRHKRKRHHPSPEVCIISSESENGDFSASKYSDESDDPISLSSNSSRERIVVKSKKRRHKCKYRDIESKEIADENGYISRKPRSHHREHKRHHQRKDEEFRKGHEEVIRIKLEPTDYHSKYTESARKRHDEKQRERDEVVVHSHHSHSSSTEHDGKHRRTYHDGSSNHEANRPVKEEPVSDDEPNFEWGKKSDEQKDNKKGPEDDKAKPNFGLSGKLTEDSNTFNGVVIKYSEPPEARKPKRRWRLYPFKGDQGLPTLYIHRQSCYLIGRERKVADIPIDHPSCSKQHAALQYRLVPYEREDGTKGRRVRPYIIDLESSNGTFVNNVKVEPKKYIELLEKDVIKFGYSSREYVLLHEQSKDDDADDDIPLNEETNC